MAKTNKKIYPETWALCASMVISALLIVFGFRGCSGCKDCNDNSEQAPKAKADTVWVKAKADTVRANDISITITGDNNGVFVNQGTGNTMTVVSQQNAVKPNPKPKSQVKKQEVVKQKTEQPKDKKLIVDYTVSVKDCHGNTTKTDKLAYFTVVGDDKVRLDSIVDAKKVVDTIFKTKYAVIDTCDCQNKK